MEWVKVKNQQELEDQVAKGNGVIIDSSWEGGGWAVLRESSHAVLWESSHAELWGSSHAVLRESSHAVLRESSHAELWGSSHAELRESSHAELWGSSHAELRESSHAVLRGSSHAELWGSSHAVLRESSHAVLRESSHAELWGSSHAVLWDFAMAHHNGQDIKLLSPHAVATKINYPTTIKEWLDLKGIKPQRGKAILWKAVRPDGMDFRTGTVKYELDKEVVDPNWDENFTGECGYALHLSDSPSGARYFVPSGQDFKLLQCKVKLDDCRVTGGRPDYPMKLRARACTPIKEFPMDYEAVK